MMCPQCDELMLIIGGLQPATGAAWLVASRNGVVVPRDACHAPTPSHIRECPRCGRTTAVSTAPPDAPADAPTDAPA